MTKPGGKWIARYFKIRDAKRRSAWYKYSAEGGDPPPLGDESSLFRKEQSAAYDEAGPAGCYQAKRHTEEE